MTETKIQNILNVRFHNHKYKLFNSYVFKRDWESDFFSMSENGYTYEVEIKISRGDYQADFKKYKHQLFENIKKPLWVMNQGERKVHYGYEKKQVMTQSRAGSFLQWTSTATYAPATKVRIINSEKITVPNKFFYAVPKDLVKIEEVPEYAGLIYVEEREANIVKPAPFLHKRKLDLNKVLLDKFYYECITHQIDNNNKTEYSSQLKTAAFTG